MYNNDIPTRAELPSQAQLLRSTGIAILTAGAMLITVILPSEYGIDPTGVGKVLGLTAMGNIKATLAAEAAADQTAAGKAKPAPAVAATPAGDQVARSDEMIVTLKPGEGTEVKMAMLKGATVKYEWKTDGGLVNHDTHGEPANGPANTVHRYLKEKQVAGNSGEFTAAFDGSHGWFWRNRSDNEVRISLKANGVYSSIKRIQ
jgi:hypothetical protein